MSDHIGTLRMDGERWLHGKKSVCNRRTSELAESAVLLRELWDQENLNTLLLTTSILQIWKYGLRRNMDLESDLRINPSDIA